MGPLDWLMETGGDEAKDTTWLWAPAVCTVVLTAGVFAGVVRALRQGGTVSCGCIPLPRCRWLTSRWAVRIGSWIALVAGLCGLLAALRRFLFGWNKKVPPYLLSLTMVTYALLVVALFLALLARRYTGKVRAGFRQAASSSFLGGLAAGLTTEVLCSGLSVHDVSTEWRRGCAMLGACSGLLLLGLTAFLSEGQEWSRQEASAADEPSDRADAETEAEHGPDLFGDESLSGPSGPMKHVVFEHKRSDSDGTERSSWLGNPWPQWSRDADVMFQNQSDMLPHMPQSDLAGLSEPLMNPLNLSPRKMGVRNAAPMAWSSNVGASPNSCSVDPVEVRLHCTSALHPVLAS